MDPRKTQLSWAAFAARHWAAAAAAVVSHARPAGASAASGCHRVASPSGNDRAAGTEAAPFRTFKKLSSVLQPGQYGCLRGGVYDEDPTIRVSGTPAAPITITSFPGEWATLYGRLSVEDNVTRVVVQHMTLDGAGCSRRRLQQAAQPDGPRRQRRLHLERGDEPAHRDLLRGRQRVVRARLQRRDPRQPHPRLRGAAAHQPPARHLPALAVLRPGDRQLDPRQRGHGREPVPERRRPLLRPQRDPRQRRQPELRGTQQGRRVRVVRQQPDREQRHDVPARAQEHHLLVAVREPWDRQRPASQLHLSGHVRGHRGLRAPGQPARRPAATSTLRTPTSGCGPAARAPPCSTIRTSRDRAAAGAGDPPGRPADRAAVRRLTGPAARAAGR